MATETRASDLLVAAADRIRDLADKATPGPWSTVRRVDSNGNLRQSDFTRPPVGDGCPPQTRAVRPHETPDYEWIAALSPAVAPHLERWLLEIWKHIKANGYRDDCWMCKPAIAFARSILGSGVDTHG